MITSLAAIPKRVRRVIGGMRTDVGRRALRSGVVATSAPQTMLRRIAPVLVVDVGANRGQFALDVVTVLPSARVISFEPLPAEAEVFKRIFHDYPNVELKEHALGRSHERRTMHMSSAPDSSSLLELSPLQEEFYPGTAEAGTIPVDVLTLDEALGMEPLPAASLLKADVQGYELEILRGARKSLPSFRWIYLEVSFVELYAGQPLAHEVIGYLAARGFVPCDTSKPSRRGGRTIQIDVLFERTTPAVDSRCR